MTQTDFYTILPLIVLAAWACVLLLADLFIPKDRKDITAFLSALGLALTLGLTITQVGREQTGFNNIIFPLRIEEDGKVIYNHVLSALRTFGALDILLDMVRASLSPAALPSFEAKLTGVNGALNTLSVMIPDKLAIPCGTISYNDYNTLIKP